MTVPRNILVLHKETGNEEAEVRIEWNMEAEELADQPVKESNDEQFIVDPVTDNEQETGEIESSPVVDQ